MTDLITIGDMGIGRLTYDAALAKWQASIQDHAGTIRHYGDYHDPRIAAETIVQRMPDYAGWRRTDDGQDVPDSL